jgi:hypothetical protein
MDKYNELKSGKSIPLLSYKDMKRLQTPVGKAIYQSSFNKTQEEKKLGRPRKNNDEKAKPTDRIQCDICGNIFSRCHRAAHKKTKVHQAYEQMNQKLVKLLLDTDI